jgi:SagB-type dehydrogenase family enzyme
MSATSRQEGLVKLPKPRRGDVRLDAAIAQRRSVREFEPEPLTDAQLSQLLWAAQGITGDDGLRAAPSAGALYPLEVYVAVADGLLRYVPRQHALAVVGTEDLRPALCRASLDQTAIRRAPAVFVFAAVYARTARKYGEIWSRRYVDMELGHAAQNLLLQAVALDLGGVPIAAFHEDRVHEVLALPEEEEPRYLLPVGRPRRSSY